MVWKGAGQTEMCAVPTLVLLRLQNPETGSPGAAPSHASSDAVHTTHTEPATPVPRSAWQLLDGFRRAAVAAAANAGLQEKADFANDDEKMKQFGAAKVQRVPRAHLRLGSTGGGYQRLWC